MRLRRTALALLATLVAAPALHAQDREWIGTARIFTNDYLGDGRDRWRSGNYTYSHLRGRKQYDGQPQAFGDILEFRLHTEVISPSADSGARADRPYAGAIGLGLFTHFGAGEVFYTLGADITAIGPQTGISAFQEDFHDRFDIPLPDHIGDQLGDAFHFSGYGEAAIDLTFGDAVVVRPFAAAQIGVETLARVGFDMRIADFGHDDLVVRDPVSGFLSPAARDKGHGFEWMIGGDIAYVENSVYLPSAQGYTAETTRYRARAGAGYLFEDGTSLFYGATYLSPEFEGQSEGQVVGSLRLNFNF